MANYFVRELGSWGVVKVLGWLNFFLFVYLNLIRSLH